MADETEVVFSNNSSSNNFVNNNSNEQSNNNTPHNNHSSSGNDVGYIEVKVDEGNSKNKDGHIIIRTSVKGFLYRSEIFKDNNLINAKEIDCKDLEVAANKEATFKERYLSTHNTFVFQYIARDFFKEALKDEGKFKDGDEYCTIITSYSENIIRSVILLDGDEFDTKEIPILDNMKNKSNLIKSKYTIFHNEIQARFLDTDKFPINTFLNPILEKLPFYKKNPMYAFYLFLFLVILGLVAIKIALCSDLMVNSKKGKEKFEYMVDLAPFCSKFVDKITKKCTDASDAHWQIKSKVFNKKTCKSVCSDYEFIDSESCDKWNSSIDLVSSKLNISPYLITPSFTLELSDKKITTIYLKNNSENTLRIKVVQVSIDNNPNNEIIFFINDKTEISLSRDVEDIFELKLEGTYLKAFKKGEYLGYLVFLIINDNKTINTTERRNFKFIVD